MDVVLRIKELEKGHKLKAAATLWPESELLVNLFEKKTTATKSLKDQRLSPAFNPTSIETRRELLGVIFFSIQEMAPVPLFMVQSRPFTTTKVGNKHLETMWICQIHNNLAVVKSKVNKALACFRF